MGWGESCWSHPGERSAGYTTIYDQLLEQMENLVHFERPQHEAKSVWESGVKPMIGKNEIDEIVRRIVEGVDPEKVILFGSYAYGEPDEDSDIDILVIKDMDMPRYRRVTEIRRHLRGMKIPIDIVVYTREEIEEFRGVKTAFINQIVEEGRVLYER